MVDTNIPEHIRRKHTDILSEQFGLGIWNGLRYIVGVICSLIAVVFFFLAVRDAPEWALNFLACAIMAAFAYRILPEHLR